MIEETMTRRERIQAAINLEPYDRVPVAPLMEAGFPARHKGLTVAEGIKSYSTIGFQAIVDVFDEVGGWDSMILPGFSLASNHKSIPAVGIGKRIFPGQDISVNSPIQYVEGEDLTVEDYDEIIRLGYKEFLKNRYEKYATYPLEKAIVWAEKADSPVCQGA